MRHGVFDVRISEVLLRVAAFSLALLGAEAARAFADPTPVPSGNLIAGPEADQPADVIGKGYFELALAGGQERTIRVAVKNDSAEPLTLRTYAVDGVPTTGGGLDYNTFDQPVKGVGTWLSLDAATLQLAPSQAGRVTATVKVAANATPGDHVAGIAIEDAKVRQSGTGTNLVIDVHYRRAIAVVITVPGERTQSVAVDTVALTEAAPGSRATVQVRNTGNSLVKGTGTLEIGGTQASSAAQTFPFDLLIPGTGTGLVVPLPNVTLAPGTYAAHVVLRASDGQPLADWQGKAVLTAAGQQPEPTAPPTAVALAPVEPAPQAVSAPPAQAGDTNSTFLWVMAGLSALLILGLGVFIGRRR